jgi:hypothetical protein
MMRIRLRLLLTSFNKSVMDYALARLEVALANPGVPAPPIVDRVGVPLRNGGDDFEARWPTALAQTSLVAQYVADGTCGSLGIKRDLAWARLVRAAKMIGQFADSIECFGAERGESRTGEGGA